MVVKSESESEAMSSRNSVVSKKRLLDGFSEESEPKPEATLKFLRGEVEARLPKFRRLWRRRFGRCLQICFGASTFVLGGVLVHRCEVRVGGDVTSKRRLLDRFSEELEPEPEATLKFVRG